MAEETKIKIKRSGDGFDIATSQLTLDEGEPFLYTKTTNDDTTQLLYIGDGITSIPNLTAINQTTQGINPSVSQVDDGGRQNTKLQLQVESGQEAKSASCLLPAMNVFTSIDTNYVALLTKDNTTETYYTSNSSDSTPPVQRMFCGDIILEQKDKLGTIFKDSTLGKPGEMLICYEVTFIDNTYTYYWRPIYVTPVVDAIGVSNYETNTYDINIYLNVPNGTESSTSTAVSVPMTASRTLSDTCKWDEDNPYIAIVEKLNATADECRIGDIGSTEIGKSANDLILFKVVVSTEGTGESEVTYHTQYWLSPSWFSYYETQKLIEANSVTTSVMSQTELFQSIINSIYPVGSYYWTSDSEFSPTTSFGGTWQRVTDKFIVAAGNYFYPKSTENVSPIRSISVTDINGASKRLDGAKDTEYAKTNNVEYTKYTWGTYTTYTAYTNVEDTRTLNIFSGNNTTHVRVFFATEENQKIPVYKPDSASQIEMDIKKGQMYVFANINNGTLSSEDIYFNDDSIITSSTPIQMKLLQDNITSQTRYPSLTIGCEDNTSETYFPVISNTNNGTTLSFNINRKNNGAIQTVLTPDMMASHAHYAAGTQLQGNGTEITMGYAVFNSSTAVTTVKQGTGEENEVSIEPISAYTGLGVPLCTLPPYEVAYCWKRTQ